MYRYRQRDPGVDGDMPRLPTVGSDRDVEPPAEGPVDPAAGSWFARWCDVTENRERGLGDVPPDLLAREARLCLGVSILRLHDRTSLDPAERPNRSFVAASPYRSASRSIAARRV